MHVICKNCGDKIPVLYRPKGHTNVDRVQTNGPVRIGEGGISLGSGGKITISAGGGIGFGGPKQSQFKCPKCKVTNVYQSSEIVEE